MPTCRLCKHVNPPGTDLWQQCGNLLPGGAQVSADDVRALLAAGNKVAAVKLYREQTGAGLREAKEATDALAAEHGIDFAGSSCLAAGLVMLVLAAAAAVAGFLLMR